MTQELKQTLDFYQKGLITKEEFKRLVNCVSEVKLCKCCDEEFISDNGEKFCQMCQREIYDDQQYRWAEECDKDAQEQEERHEPLEKAVEDVDFEDYIDMSGATPGER